MLHVKTRYLRLALAVQRDTAVHVFPDAHLNCCLVAAPVRRPPCSGSVL